MGEPNPDQGMLGGLEGIAVEATLPDPDPEEVSYEELNLQLEGLLSDIQDIKQEWDSRAEKIDELQDELNSTGVTHDLAEKIGELYTELENL